MEKEELLCPVDENAAIMENSMEVPQKLKVEPTYDPVIALLGIYPKGMKAGY